MNRLDYLLQKISLALFLFATCLTVLFALSFSTDIARLYIDPGDMRFFESFVRKGIDTHIVEVVNYITSTYHLFLDTNDQIFKLSIICLIIVGFVFLVGSYSRKRYTLFQNILTKIIPLVCIVVAIYALIIIQKLRVEYEQIEFDYYKNFITVTDNEHGNLFADSIYIVKSLTFFNLAYYVYIFQIFTSLLVIGVTMMKWLKLSALKMKHKGDGKYEYQAG